MTHALRTEVEAGLLKSMYPGWEVLLSWIVFPSDRRVSVEFLDTHQKRQAIAVNCFALGYPVR